jgi:hypothetical protein
MGGGASVAKTLDLTLTHSVFPQERDGYPADTECIFMTDGASPGVHRIIQLLTRSESDSFLTPVPQYPLYSASLALYGTSLTPYYLDESINWGLNLEHLQEQYDNVGAVRSLYCRLDTLLQPAETPVTTDTPSCQHVDSSLPLTRAVTHSALSAVFAVSIALQPYAALPAEVIPPFIAL